MRALPVISAKCLVDRQGFLQSLRSAVAVHLGSCIRLFYCTYYFHYNLGVAAVPREWSHGISLCTLCNSLAATLQREIHLGSCSVERQLMHN